VKRLADDNPALAREWHPTRNKALEPSEISHMSRKSVWWLCSNGHSWQATVLARQKGLTCPKCTPFGTSDTERRIFDCIQRSCQDAEHRAEVKVRGKYVEVDVFVPSLQLAIEYDGPHHVKRVRQDEEKNFLLQREGIKLVRVRTSGLPELRPFGSVVIVHNSDHPEGLNHCLQAIQAFIRELTSQGSPTMS
jgi:hypothetical protein